MIPFFVSDNSIGRSILKLKPSHEGGPADILTMAKEANLPEVFLVEDSMIGFLEAHKTFSQHNIPLRFGVRFNICNDVTSEKENSSFKIIIFALNDKGCKELFHIFSEAHANPERGGFLDVSILKSCKTDNLAVVHPFYDSYLFNNTFYFKNCIYESFLPAQREYYAVENNKLPFDEVMQLQLSLSSRVTQQLEVKTILYRYRADVTAYQTYRMACNRSFSKSRGLSAPDLEHFGSNEFCFQSYMEETSGEPFKI